MTSEKKSLMRCIGEFAGHVMKAVTQPANGDKTVVRQEQEEKTRGNVTLRRTVIEEIEGPADKVSGDDKTCS
jgi:hypothetical protein